MPRLRRTLSFVAPLCWTAALVSHCVSVLAAEESERIEWGERRNLFLLCSSLSTNALAAAAIYGYARRRLRTRRE
jgi:hypothetical protein